MRDPTHVAQLAATLDELSGGRAEVVPGIGNLAMLEQYGIDWHGTRPVGRLREAHHVIRTCSTKVRSTSREDFFGTRASAPRRGPSGSRPLKLGAMGGPKSMELAGEIADGLHTACAYSAEALSYAVHHFKVGAERAGREQIGSTSATLCSGRSPRTAM